MKEKKANTLPWDFSSLPYDQRTGNFTPAGQSYGVGHRQPIGHEGKAKKEVPAIPFGKRFPGK